MLKGRHCEHPERLICGVVIARAYSFRCYPERVGQSPGEGSALKIVEYSQRFERQINDYQLQDVTFTGLPRKAVAIAKSNMEYHPSLAVTSDNEVPTFFVLDYGTDKFRYTNTSRSMLLRSFSTDDRYLRKGYASEALALLPAYVRGSFPDVIEIVLGVNRKNVPAQRLYEKAGFERRADTFVGRRGEQFIYTMAIG